MAFKKSFKRNCHFWFKDDPSLDAFCTKDKDIKKGISKMPKTYPESINEDGSEFVNTFV